MTTALRIAPELVRSHRPPEEPQLTVLGILSILLQRKRLMALIAAAGTLPVLLWVSMMRPLYVSEATLELSFRREEVAAAATVDRQTASVDPGALVNGAALQIASRANAARVVRLLGLDKAAAEQRPSVLSAMAGVVRGLFGVSSAQPTSEERAVNELLRNVKVSYKAHLYVIGIAYGAGDPEDAARFANAFAIEYLRGERLKELASQRAIAQSELRAASERLGVRHPRRLQIEGRVEHLDAEIARVSGSPPDARSFLLGGQYLTLAEPIMTPASQKRMAILVVGLCLVLMLAAAVAFVVDRLVAGGVDVFGLRWLDRIDGRS